MSQKLWGVLVCRQLWILYSKINFEVFYFTQFSIFFEEKKNHSMWIVYYNVSTIGIGIFQFQNKILNKIVFWIILYFFLLLFFSYMLYNSKWFEIFQACSQLALKNESKEAPPFGAFFHANVTLWSAAACFFAGLKKWFLSIQTLISCNPHGGNFWNFFHIFSN